MSGLFYASYVALWVLIVVQAVLLVLLYRHFGMMSLGTLEGVQRDGLPVGAAAPAIGGVTADGVDGGWEPKRGQPQFLLFAAPDCEPCATILPVLNRLARTLGSDGPPITAVVPGPRAEAARMVELYHPPFPCLAEDGSGAFDRFRVRVTPFGFVVGADGRVLAKGLCGDPRRLRELFGAAGLRDVAGAVSTIEQPVRLSVAAAPVAGIGRNGSSR